MPALCWVAVLKRVVAVLLASVTAWAVPMEMGAQEGADQDSEKVAAKAADASALVAKLGDGNWQVRERAMRALIALGAPARDALRSALTSPDLEVRWRARYALTRLDAHFDLPEVDRARQLYAAAARGRAQEGGEEAARALYQEAIARFPKTRWAAAARERLASLRSRRKPAVVDEAGVARLVAQLGAASWAERQEASVRLAALGEAARAALEGAAKSSDPEVAWRARRLLERLEAGRSRAGERGVSRRFGVRIEVMGDMARRWMRRRGGSEMDRLVRALGSENAAEVTVARDALLNFGPEAIDALVRGLEGSSEVAAVEIMDLLHRITQQNLGFDPERWRAWWRARGKREGD